MVPLLLHGRMGNVWYGMLLALTPLPLLTSDYHRGKQELWQFRLRKGKKQKYSCLSSTHLFTPIAIESSGVFGTEAISFVRELGLRLKNVTGEPASRHYLIQKLSVAVQRGNAAAILSSMGGLAALEGNFFFIIKIIFIINILIIIIIVFLFILIVVGSCYFLFFVFVLFVVF